MQKVSVRLSIVFALLAVAASIWFVSGLAAARGNAAPAGQSAATNHTLSVNGHGEVNVPPDNASISLGVQTKGTTAKDALASAANAMNAIIAAVKAQGVPDERIQTSQLSIWYDQEKDIYYASHQLTVRVDTISKVGPIIDASVDAGANNSWGVSFGLKDPSQARAQALQAAIGDARQHADAMASKLQVSITGTGSASETSYSGGPIYYSGADKASGAPVPSTPIQAGQLTISADVGVVYTFTPL